MRTLEDVRVEREISLQLEMILDREKSCDETIFKMIDNS